MAERSPVFKAILFKTFILLYHLNCFSAVVNILNLKEKITMLILKFHYIFIFLKRINFQIKRGVFLKVKKNNSY